MPLAELRDGRIELQTEFAEKDQVKAVPGTRWDTTAKTWWVPLSWAACQALRGVFGPRLGIGPALNSWLLDDLADRVNPALELREAAAVPFQHDLDPRLYPYQVAGAFFLARAQHALLGDDMGTGKSATTAAALGLLEARGVPVYPVCCIVPNSTKQHWAMTFKTWLPQAEVFVVGGAAAKRAKTLKAAAASARAVVILNWEAVRAHSRLAPYGAVRLKRCQAHGGDDPRVKPTACEVHPKELNELGFHAVVCDEAHRQKDPKSKQTRAAWAVQHGAEVEFRFSLTGTPIANHPGDLWGLMHGVDPVDFPSRSRWVDRYALLAWSRFGGLDIIGLRPDTRDEFFRILDPRFRRMTKMQVLKHLPPKVRTVRTAELLPKQRKAYDELADGLLTRLEDGSLVLATNSMVQATRLSQLASAYAEVDGEGHLHLAEPSPKVDVLVEVLEELGGKPVAVCAESRQLIMLAAARLTKLGIEHRIVVGGMTDDQRANALADFQQGRAQVLLFTIKAGGVGLTMTAADTIIFLQRSWSMLDNRQAEDRVHRIGSEVHESISIIDVIAPGTVEEGQVQRLHQKLARLEEITCDRETLASLEERGQLDAEEQELLTGGVLFDLDGSDEGDA